MLSVTVNGSSIDHNGNVVGGGKALRINTLGGT